MGDDSIVMIMKMLSMVRHIINNKARASYTIEGSMVLGIILSTILIIIMAALQLYADVCQTADEPIDHSLYTVKDVMAIKRMGGDLYESVCEQCGVQPQDEE